MNTEIKSKLKKVYALVERGATEGEREAARTQLEKIMGKYNLTESDLDSLDKEYHYFTYTSKNEITLLIRIAKIIGGVELEWHKWNERKRMVAHMTYLESITITCAYEYFRRHMKLEWNKACADIVKRCRTNKTRNQKRSLLQVTFLSQYLIASNLYNMTELTTVSLSEMSKKDRAARSAVANVKGGQYNKQVSNGLLLEELNQWN